MPPGPVRVPTPCAGAFSQLRSGVAAFLSAIMNYFGAYRARACTFLARDPSQIAERAGQHPLSRLDRCGPVEDSAHRKCILKGGLCSLVWKSDTSDTVPIFGRLDHHNVEGLHCLN